MSDWILRVGELQVIALLDSPVVADWDMFFPQQGAGFFQSYRRLYPESYTGEGRFQTFIQAYVIRTVQRTILVDTGIGPGPHDWLGGIRGHLLDDMRMKGVRPEEVDAVLFTHLHPDHVGWNLLYDGETPRITFPRATYYAPRADWEWFTDPSRIGQWGTDRTVAPLKTLGVLQLFDGEIALGEGVTTLPTPGHTPGHTSVLLSSAGERALICGDLAHHPAQVDRVDCSSAFDNDAAQAAQTRAKICEMLEAEKMVAIFCHFAPPGFGRLARLREQRIFRAL